jgi:hypothetical protein
MPGAMTSDEHMTIHAPMTPGSTAHAADALAVFSPERHILPGPATSARHAGLAPVIPVRTGIRTGR